MRLYECHAKLGTLSEQEFLEALTLIESYVLRRAICGYQTRGYWQIFANLAYRVGASNPLTDLKVDSPGCATVIASLLTTNSNES